MRTKNMKISKTTIAGLLVIEPRVFADSRGYFFESYHQDKYSQLGIDCCFIQDNESMSSYGVIRGLHYQAPPYTQAKLVRVISGRVLDVAVDIRVGSPTYGQNYAVELSGDNKLQFYIPRGFAHGFAVLSETALFSYKCDNVYHPASERCIRYDDLSLGIDWGIPAEKRIVSAKDEQGRPFAEAEVFRDYT